MSIIVNGKVYATLPNGTLEIKANGEVWVDGVLVGNPTPPLEVEIKGDFVGTLAVEGRATCHAAVGYVKAGGSVTCGSVGGNVESNGRVECADVSGNVNANGSVTAGAIHGDVRANGSVRLR
jgi:cytoskeletal protein CcmA (bactofilin family)